MGQRGDPPKARFILMPSSRSFLTSSTILVLLPKANTKGKKQKTLRACTKQLPASYTKTAWAVKSGELRYYAIGSRITHNASTRSDYPLSCYLVVLPCNLLLFLFFSWSSAWSPCAVCDCRVSNPSALYILDHRHVDCSSISEISTTQRSSSNISWA